MVLSVNHSVISRSGKSVNSMGLRNTLMPLPSSQVSVAEWPSPRASSAIWKPSGGDYVLEELLREGDFVEQPVGAARIGHVLGAVRKQDAFHKAVPVPVLAAAELAQIGFG